MATTTCEDLMTRHPRSCRPDGTLLDCIRIMKELNVGYVPICEPSSGRLVGVLTDRDAAMALSRDDKASSIPTKDVMTRDPVTCRPEDDIFAAAHAMENAQIRRIPIVDRDNTLVGVVSLADIARRAPGFKALERELSQVVERVSQPSV